MPDFPKKSGGLNFGQKSGSFERKGFSAHSGVQPGPMSGMPYASPNKQGLGTWLKGLFSGSDDEAGVPDLKSQEDVKEESKLSHFEQIFKVAKQSGKEEFTYKDPKTGKVGTYHTRTAEEEASKKDPWERKTPGDKETITKIDPVGLKPIEVPDQPEPKLAKVDMSQMPETKEKEGWWKRTFGEGSKISEGLKKFKEKNPDFGDEMVALGAAVGSEDMGKAYFQAQQVLSKKKLAAEKLTKQEELLAAERKRQESTESRSAAAELRKIKLFEIQTDPEKLALSEKTQELQNIRRQQLIDAYDKKLELEGNDPFTKHT